MQLINALVTSPEDLDFRIHLRNEFLRCGLKKILPVSIPFVFSFFTFFFYFITLIAYLIYHFFFLTLDFFLFIYNMIYVH